MKLSIATITFATLFQATAAFSPIATAFSTKSSVVVSSNTAVFAEPADDEEEGGLDLNLEEMFDM